MDQAALSRGVPGSGEADCQLPPASSRLPSSSGLSSPRHLPTPPAPCCHRALAPVWTLLCEGNACRVNRLPTAHRSALGCVEVPALVTQSYPLSQVPTLQPPPQRLT